MLRVRALFRFCVVVLTIVVLLAGIGVTAWASDAPGSVNTVTGCVNSATGTLGKLILGFFPSSGCGSGEFRVRIAGGDITAVLPTASGGLIGGARNGEVRLGIDYPALDDRYINEGDSITWRRTWSASTEYVAGDAVYHSGSSFVVVAPNVNSIPVHGSTWNLLARKGTQDVPDIMGPEGAQGSSGTEGPQGPQGPGLRSAVASFDGVTCAEIENTVLTGTKLTDLCYISVPAGATDGVPLPFVSGATLGAFIPDFNGLGIRSLWSHQSATSSGSCLHRLGHLHRSPLYDRCPPGVQMPLNAR